MIGAGAFDPGGPVATNVAHMGKFSSDRTIRQYAEEVWRVASVTRLTAGRRDLHDGRKLPRRPP
jgi:hypothetical protein